VTSRIREKEGDALSPPPEKEKKKKKKKGRTIPETYPYHGGKEKGLQGMLPKLPERGEKKKRGKKKKNLRFAKRKKEGGKSLRCEKGGWGKKKRGGRA